MVGKATTSMDRDKSLHCWDGKHGRWETSSPTQSRGKNTSAVGHQGFFFPIKWGRGQGGARWIIHRKHEDHHLVSSRSFSKLWQAPGLMLRTLSGISTLEVPETKWVLIQLHSFCRGGLRLQLTEHILKERWCVVWSGLRRILNIRNYRVKTADAPELAPQPMKTMPRAKELPRPTV